MREGLAPWHAVCPDRTCRYESSALQPRLNDSCAHRTIDETLRLSALRPLRQANFRALLDHLLELKPSGGRLLEVGSAHGWFLELASRHFHVLGIEPDERVASLADNESLSVLRGLFPDALPADARFDAIVFNDVFEHLPSVDAMVRACHERLNPQGLLVINLPSSDGIIYRVARMLARAGRTASFERLWQKGMPSPHLHYFNAGNLKRLLERHHFAAARQGTLASIRLEGLYPRIAFAGSSRRLRKASVYLLLAAALPVVKIMPADIVFLIARKGG